MHATFLVMNYQNILDADVITETWNITPNSRIRIPIPCSTRLCSFLQKIFKNLYFLNYKNFAKFLIIKNLKTRLNYFKIKIHQFEKITNTNPAHSGTNNTKFNFLGFRFLLQEIKSSIQRRQCPVRTMNNGSSDISPILCGSQAIISLYIPVYSTYHYQKAGNYLGSP